MTRLHDVLAGLVASAILASLALPALADLRSDAGLAGSLSNLQQLGAAHFLYAMDHDGRQVTWIDDEITSYGDGVASAFDAYRQLEGHPHPALGLGWGVRDNDGDDLRWFAYRTTNSLSASLLRPIGFETPLRYYGSFRFQNAEAFNPYVNGRYYDHVHYAPKDAVVLELAEPLFDGVHP